MDLEKKEEVNTGLGNNYKAHTYWLSYILTSSISDSLRS